MKRLKYISLAYSTAICTACMIYFDTNVIRVTLMAIGSFAVNFGLYKIYDFMMKRRFVGFFVFLGIIAVDLFLMGFFISLGDFMGYGLPFWLWIFTPQSALEYTPYFTFAMFWLINLYVSGCIYYGTLNRYVLSVNFLITFIPFANFARNEDFLPVWIAVPLVFLFFLNFILCRQTIMPTVLPKEFKRLKKQGFKIPLAQRRKAENTYVYNDLSLNQIKKASIAVLIPMTVILLIPKPNVAAEREAFENSIGLDSIVSMFTAKFNTFTQVADPSIFHASTTNIELYRVWSDEPLRLKGAVYGEYDISKNSWSTDNSEYGSYGASDERNQKIKDWHDELIARDMPVRKIVIEAKTNNANYMLCPTGFSESLVPEPVSVWRSLSSEVRSNRRDKHWELEYYSEKDITQRQEALMLANADLEDKNYKTERNYAKKWYTDTSEIPVKIAALAEEVAGGFNSDIEKARTLEDYFSQNGYIYDLDYKSTDINDFFFVSKRGVCYEYATGMVLMARSLGIPARFVTGFAAYDYDRNNGYYSVREKSAHAFPELFIRGYGWISFEPTVAITEPQAESVLARASASDVRTAGLYILIAAAAFGAVYFFVLPRSREFIFRRKAKKVLAAGDRKAAYSLVFSRLRDIFKLRQSAALEDVLSYADTVFNHRAFTSKKLTVATNELRNFNPAAVVYNGSEVSKNEKNDFLLIKTYKTTVKLTKRYQKYQKALARRQGKMITA